MYWCWALQKTHTGPVQRRHACFLHVPFTGKYRWTARYRKARRFVIKQTLPVDSACYEQASYNASFDAYFFLSKLVSVKPFKFWKYTPSARKSQKNVDWRIFIPTHNDAIAIESRTRRVVEKRKATRLCKRYEKRQALVATAENKKTASMKSLTPLGGTYSSPQAQQYT